MNALAFFIINTRSEADLRGGAPKEPRNFSYFFLLFV